MTGTVRSMDDIGAGDIEVAQQWMHVVTEKNKRHVARITSIDGDRVTLRSGERYEVFEEVSFGALLSDWVLVGEAFGS